MGRKKTKFFFNLPSANLDTRQRLSLPSARSQGARQRIFKKNCKKLCQVPLGPALGKASNLKAHNGLAQPTPSSLPPAPPRPCRAAAAPGRPRRPRRRPPPAGELLPGPPRRPRPAPAPPSSPGGPAPAPRARRRSRPAPAAPRPCPELADAPAAVPCGRPAEGEGEEQEEEREGGGGRERKRRGRRKKRKVPTQPPVDPRAAAVIPAVVAGPRSCHSCRQGKPYPCRVSSSSS